jgi:hypothetical protein
MPTKTGPARTGFFIRESIERPFVCVHEIMLAAGHHRSAPAAGPAPKPVIAIPAEPAATSVSPTLLDRLHAFLGSFVEPFVWPLLEHCKKYLRLSQWNLPAAVILLVLFVLAGGLWVRARGLTGAAVPMRVSDLGSNLRIEWDANQKAVRAALAATLEIHDGARKPLSIPLTRSALEHGSVLYIPQSDNLQASLKLIQRNGLMSESVIYFINPTRPAPQPSSTPVTPDIAAAIVPGQPVPATPVEEIGPPATRQKKPAPKVFRPPDSQPVAAAPLRASLNLPDAPDIPAAPAPAPTLSSALLAATPRLTGPPQLRTGHLIWTGSLRKNTVLTLTPDGASTGVLNGRLPGVPVKINVQPAELTDTGIAVYSNDRERSGAGGQPSTWNGWNVMVYYDWDPKKIAQLDVVEPPGPANNWKRLVLRNGGRNASVLVVNWQRAEGR